MRDLNEEQIRAAVEKAKEFFKEDLSDGLYKRFALAACDKVMVECFRAMMGAKPDDRS